MFIVIVLIAIGAVTAYNAYYMIPRSGPMYPQYMDIVEVRKRSHDILWHDKSFVCPWCRKRCGYPTGYDKDSSWPPHSVFCQKCQDEIRKVLNSEVVPDFLERYEYESIKNDARFWVIYRDYEKGDIPAQKARNLVHCLAPNSNYDKIELIRYRGEKTYIAYDKHQSGMYCTVCRQAVHECTCSKEYLNNIAHGNYPSEFKPYLDRLRQFNPKSVPLYYYKRVGKIYVEMLPRPEGFDVADYYTLNDWQTLKTIAYMIKQEQYSIETVDMAIRQVIQLIVTDLKLQVGYYEALARGEDVSYPLLPSVNPKKISEDELEAPKPRRPTPQEMLARYMK